MPSADIHFTPIDAGRALSRRRALAWLAAAGTAPLLACTAPSATAPAPTARAAPAAPPASNVAPTAAPAPATSAALEKVTFRLDFLPAGFHTPFYAARDRGWYREQGLDVEIGDSNGSTQAATLVATGNATFSYVDGGAIVRAIAAGQPIQSVALCLAKSPLGYAVPDDLNVRAPKDLEGKAYGPLTSGAAHQLWPIFAATNGIDASTVTVVNLDGASLVPALLQRRVDFVDAIVGRLDLLMAEGGRPGRTLALADYGLDYLGHGIVANLQTIREKPGPRAALPDGDAPRLRAGANGPGRRRGGAQGDDPAVDHALGHAVRRAVAQDDRAGGRGQPAGAHADDQRDILHGAAAERLSRAKLPRSGLAHTPSPAGSGAGLAAFRRAG